MPEYIDIDVNALSNQERYKLLIGSVVPRPIGFVSTLSPEGHPNLAPFSFFNGVCPSPLIVSIAVNIRSSDGGKKDTLRNVEATGELVIHIVTEDIVEAMNLTAGEYPPDINEFEVSGLTPIPSEKVKPYRVKESPIQMECKLHQIVTIGDTVGAGSLILARVVMMHMSPEVYEDGRINIRKLKPVSRLAGTSYAKVNDIFDLERPSVKPGVTAS